MDDIFEKMYTIHLETKSFPYGKPNKEEIDEEWELYQFLYDNLIGEQKRAFLQYAELVVARQERERKAVYEYGFKTAIKLFVQSLKD